MLYYDCCIKVTEHLILSKYIQEVPVVARKGRAASKAATEKIANNVKVIRIVDVKVDVVLIG